MTARRAFRAMGTDIELLVESEDVAEAFERAEGEFHRLEAILSRFRDDSELSRLNRDGTLEAGHDLRAVVELAVAARSRTAGRFDPTVHDAVVAAGYDRTFDDLPRDVLDATPATVPASVGGDVYISHSRIELRDGVRLDLGGIGKGYAAERAAELLALAGPCLVNAGGDIAVRGGSWPVGVETGDGSITLELTGGGLATSGRDRRRWRQNGRERHHLIDPRTGQPAESDLLRVTVVASDAVEAEIGAKWLFLAGGADRAAREADAAGLPAVLVSEDGCTVLAGGITR